VRAQKVLVQAPPLVRRRGQAPGEQVFFLHAQPADVPDSFEHARDFLFHVLTLVSSAQRVELETAGAFDCPVAPIDHVMDRSGILDAHLPSHAPKLV